MSELGKELAAGPLSGLRLPLESVAGWTQCPQVLSPSLLEMSRHKDQGPGIGWHLPVWSEALREHSSPPLFFWIVNWGQAQDGSEGQGVRVACV